MDVKDLNKKEQICLSITEIKIIVYRIDKCGLKTVKKTIENTRLVGILTSFNIIANLEYRNEYL